MSLIQIPNLPAVIGLDGSELFEGVQAGTSVKISLAQMIAATRSGLPTTLPIPVSLGGTGVTTLTGYVKGSGTSPFTASPTIPNTDITGLGTMSTQNANAVAITGGTAALTGASSVTVNSASAAFTVTQTGAGNAFVVEDSASTDSTPFIVDAAGNVGIGASAPSSKLELRGASPQSITISHTNGTGYDTTLTATYSATKSFEILSGGFSAFSLRPTDGAAVIGAKLRVDRGASAPEIWLNGASGTDQVGLKAGTAGLFAMEFYTAAAERMRITSGGNVGIGTTSPGKRLDVAGDVVLPNNGILNFYDAGGVARNTVQFLSGEVRLGGAGAGISTQTFYTSATERMRIDASGNVGIGTTAPGEKVVIEGATPFLLINNTDESKSGVRFADAQNIGERFQLAYDAGAAAMCFDRVESTGVITERFRVGSSGQWGIGGANYGTSGQTIISAGAAAAPAWGALGAAGGGTGITSYTIGDIVYASGTTTLSALADVATGNALISGGVGVAPSYGKIGLTTHVSGTLPLANGGTGVTTAPAAAAVLLGYTSTATAAGTTVLTNTSTQYQLFTGATTQTITLPVTSTLATGWSFHIVNNSTGTLTVNSSGGNLVCTVISGMTAMVTCIGTTLTTAADWEFGFTDFGTITGTGAVVLASSPAITGGSIDNMTVGATTQASVRGTSLVSNSVITDGFITHAAGTLALAFATDGVAQVTPNAAGTFTTTVPAAGTRCTLIVLTSGTTSYTMTFGTGFKTTGTLATGTVSARYFIFQFISDGTSVIEASRTVAIA